MASTIKVDKIRGAASTAVQLDGNLDVNGNSIVSASDGNIAITPNGSGKVIVDGLSLPTADGSNGQFLKTDGSGNISFGSVSSDLSGDSSPQLGGDLDVNGNSIVSTSNANINITPNGTGDVNLGADTVMVGDNNVNAIVTTQGTGDLTLSTNSGTNSGTIAIADGVNGDISVTPNGSGKVILDGLSHPTADGSANQFLKTDGSGNLSFGTPGGGKVLQVVNTQQGASEQYTSTSFGALNGLSASITPSATSSKILITISVSGNFGSSETNSGSITIYRDGADFLTAKASGQGNRTAMFVNQGLVGASDAGMHHVGASHLDSPNTTSATTYAIIARTDSGQTFYINRSKNPDNVSARPWAISEITLMEIGA
tara:strand:- start:473 stop:1585 length:1113 start_codon:yes stop_codon:yes gene_type:complete